MPFEDGSHLLHLWIWEQHFAAISRSEVFWVIHRIRSSLPVSVHICYLFLSGSIFPILFEFVWYFQPYFCRHRLIFREKHWHFPHEFIGHIFFCSLSDNDSHWKLGKLKRIQHKSFYSTLFGVDFNIEIWVMNLIPLSQFHIMLNIDLVIFCMFIFGLSS